MSLPKLSLVVALTAARCLVSSPALAAPEPSLGPFELRSPGGQHALQIGLAAQVRLTYSDTQPAADAARESSLGAEVRRLRPMLRGSFLSQRVEMFLHLNTIPGAIELLDLFGQLNLHRQFSLRVGQFKLPYTRYRLQYFTQLTFTDWSILSRYLGAERQLGAALHNGYERGSGFEYALGVFSGMNARRAHGVGLGLLYGERLANPSDLTAPAAPTTFHPELALRLGYSSPGLHPETPSDSQRGPARLGVSFSATYDIRPARYLDPALRLAPRPSSSCAVCRCTPSATSRGFRAMAARAICAQPSTACSPKPDTACSPRGSSRCATASCSAARPCATTHKSALPSLSPRPRPIRPAPLPGSTAVPAP